MRPPDPALGSPEQIRILNKVAYEGLIVNSGGELRGFGYFLLPQLPSQLPPQTPPLTPLTTPLLSGQVVLEPESP
jgi:hypothetical protein